MIKHSVLGLVGVLMMTLFIHQSSKIINKNDWLDNVNDKNNIISVFLCQFKKFV